MKVLLICLCFQVLYVSAARNRNVNRNPHPELNQPLVEPLCPQGFKVSVPNIRGMQLFGFHGSVNSPIGQREGNYSSDIRRPSANGRWEYSTSDVQLRNGDIINYWIAAQINQENFRVENMRHIVKGEGFSFPVLESSLRTGFSINK